MMKSIKSIPSKSIHGVLLMLFLSGEVRSSTVEEVYGTKSVYVQPSVTIVPGGDTDSSIKIREGDDIVLQCLTSGHPQPIIKWTIVGGILENRQIDTSKPNIVITKIQRNEGGRFSCKAMNGVGNTQFAAVRLDVLYLSPPNFRLYKSKVSTVEANSMWFENSVTIRCEVRSNPKSTVLWFKNGGRIKTALANADRIETRELTGYGSDIAVYLLKIVSAGERHYGVYECRSSLREIGRLYNISDTKVAFNFNKETVAPNIKILNSEKIVTNPGQEIVLDCMVMNGVPMPNVVWTHGNEILRSAYYSNNKTLSIKLQLHPSDAGSYVCAANNFVGNPVRKVVRIIVRYIQPMKYWITPDSLSDDRKLELEKDIKLTCHTDAQPLEELRYSWLKKNQNGVYDAFRVGNIPANVLIRNVRTPEERRFLTLPAFSSRLEIHGATSANYGTYLCRAQLTNGINGTEVEAAIVITVDSGPARVYAESKKITVKEGSAARLSCNVDGWPKPQLQWVRDGNETIDKHRIKLTEDGSLIIINVSRGDEDIYTCMPARVNGFSKLAKTNNHDDIHLDVKFPPDVSPGYIEIRGKTNASLKLPCTVMYAKPNRGLKYTWMKNGRIFSETSTGQTKLSPIERSDYGVYECIVSNDAGFSRCRINVTGAARAVEFYYGLDAVTAQSAGLTKNISRNVTYLLSWTQKNPEEVDRVIEYRIRWKRVTANLLYKTEIWKEETKVITGTIISGQLITYSLQGLDEEVEYEVEVTPKTVFGLGDSATRKIIPRAGRSPGTIIQDTSFLCQFSTPDLCGFTQEPSRRGSQSAAGILSKGDDFDWTLNNANTLIKRTRNTGPKADHSTSSKLGGYVYIESSNKNKGDTARLSSPVIPTQLMSKHCLRFFYHMWGRDIGRLNVKIRSGTLERLAWSKEGQQSNAWKQASVTLSPTTSYEIVFEAVVLEFRDFSYLGDIAIDDVTVEDGPCPAVTPFSAETKNNVSTRNACLIAIPPRMFRSQLFSLASQTSSLWTNAIDVCIFSHVFVLFSQIVNNISLS